MLTLREMRQVLAERGIRLTKSLGQNFLHDGNQLRRIADAADLLPHEQVLEIGPGLGPLTEALLSRAGHVLAIEKDLRLVRVLRDRLGPTSSLELVHADALDYLRTQAMDWQEWKLVSNLPYAVASAVLVEMTLRNAGPKRIVVTLQWEVAQRLAASAGQPEYGLLTLLIQVHYEVLDWFKVPATCFFPAPDVDSACVTLDRRAGSLIPPAALGTYEKVVKRSFSQRRKMMIKLLKTDWAGPLLESAFHDLHLSPSIRAEAVTLEQFAALTARLHASIDVPQ
jgi:16S rRNA (adenine1518-N6/adenine1519-N6)-dimethyltransferase